MLCLPEVTVQQQNVIHLLYQDRLGRNLGVSQRIQIDDFEQIMLLLTQTEKSDTNPAGAWYDQGLLMGHDLAGSIPTSRSWVPVPWDGPHPGPWR